MSYATLADHLNLNETSVKRLMSGRTPITFERIDQICEIVEMNFFDLVKLSKPSEQSQEAQLSLEQEQALADDIDLFLTFYGLVKGLTANDVIDKYKITLSRLQKSLSQLDRLLLIKLLPENRAKLVVSRSIRWNEKGPLSKKYQSEMQIDFLTDNFSRNSDMQKFLTFPLSDRSKQLFARKLREIVVELQMQSEVDVALDKNLKSTGTILLGFREWTPALLKRYLK